MTRQKIVKFYRILARVVHNLLKCLSSVKVTFKECLMMTAEKHERLITTKRGRMTHLNSR